MDQETGLYLPGKPLTVLSSQVSGSSPSIYSGQRWEGDHTDAKIHCISSHLLFWDKEGPWRLSPILSISKNLQNPILFTPLSDSILNPFNGSILLALDDFLMDRILCLFDTCFSFVQYWNDPFAHIISFKLLLIFLLDLFKSFKTAYKYR